MKPHHNICDSQKIISFENLLKTSYAVVKLSKLEFNQNYFIHSGHYRVWQFDEKKWNRYVLYVGLLHREQEWNDVIKF